MTYFVIWLEYVGPLLMFAPVLRLPLRLLAMLAFIAMETGFILNLHLGLFPFISITSILLFTSAEIWNALDRRWLHKAGAGLTLYFDKDCSFCEKTCHLLKTFLGLRQAQILPAQSVAEINEILIREFSWVVETPDGERFTKWPAMTVVFRHSPIFYWLAPLIGLPLRFGNWLYDAVSNNRGAGVRFLRRYCPGGIHTLGLAGFPTS